MKRQKRQISEKTAAALAMNEKNDQYIPIGEDVITSHDTEKNYTDRELVVMEKATGLFFKFIYTAWGCGENEFTLEMEEVFPRTKTVLIFE